MQRARKSARPFRPAPAFAEWLGEALDANPIPVDEFPSTRRKPPTASSVRIKKLMKISSLVVLASIALAPLALAAQPGEKDHKSSPSPTPVPADQPIGPLKDQKDKVSY